MDKPDDLYLSVLRLYKKTPLRKSNAVGHYFKQHWLAAKISCLRLMRRPGTLLICGALGLMLTLPLILQLGLYNLKMIGHNWDKGTHIMLYLKANTNIGQTQNLLQKLQHNHNIARIKYISAEQGANEFQASFGNIVRELPINPLPAVIEVTPKLLPDATAVTALLASLEQLPEIDEATLDMAWVKRLYYFIDLGERLIIALFALFGSGIILVISNNNRALLKSVQAENRIARLCGAPNAVIRRPLLYTGIWYGLCGGLIALLLTQLFWWWIAEPVNKLLYSYNIAALTQLTIKTAGIVLLSSILLGLISSWITYQRYITRI